MKHEWCLFHLLTLLTPVVKHLPLANGEKKEKGVKNHRNKLGCLFSQITDSQPTNVDTSAKSLLSLSSHKEARKTHYYHAQTNLHAHSEVGKDHCIPPPVTVYLETRGSCESSQVGLLCMYMGARKTLLTAVHHFDCPARLLRPKPPHTPASPPGQMAFFFF